MKQPGIVGLRERANGLKARYFPSSANLPDEGLYHFDIQNPHERMRLHLRVDPDGSGILWVNASRMMHLNPTAILMAYLFLSHIPIEQAVRQLQASYQIGRKQSLTDYTNFIAQLDELIHPDGACPVHDLNVEIIAPFSKRPSAPYRMDLALTYRCNNNCAHCYNDRPRDYPELSTAAWKSVLDRLWELGIPHVVFTGGEPTLRSDLPELIRYAQQIGCITGLNTNGRRLSNPGFIAQLVEAGLDHVQITVESHIAGIHDRLVGAANGWQQTIRGVQSALDSPLFVMTNTTLLQENAPYLEGTLDLLSALGVPTIGLNALIYAGRGKSVGTGLRESQLPALLELAQQHTQTHNQRLIWYTPTQYCNFDPMQLELGIKGCTAALYNMCIEPDGAVLPCQSYYQPVGNILTDSWNSIWNHDISTYLRDRKYIAEKCTGCTLLSECGGGCPLAPPLE